jgi:uncharacterized membrane protein
MACPDVPIPAQPLRIRLPGPIEVSGAPLSSLPSQSEVARALFGQVGAALGPFAAVFKIIEAVQAVLAVAESIPRALIGFPPDPGKITRELPKLRGAIGDLVALLPQASLPILLIDVVNALLAYINGVLTELDALAEAEANAVSARAVAAGLDAVVDAAAIASLEATASCIDAQVAQRIAGIEAASSSVNATVGVVNSLLAIINLPQIPTISGLGSDVESARASLQSLIDTVEPLAKQFSQFA